MRRRVGVGLVLLAALSVASAAQAKVIRVGTYHGVRGQYSSLTAALRAAHRGDWILIAPGDYKTRPSQIRTVKGANSFPTAFLVNKANLHIRGMNRNSVVIDGTKPGTARCSRAAKAQNFGPVVPGKGPAGVNGLMVYKADHVSIENLTTCNFLGGAQDAGNGVWWNGGADSYKIGGWGYYGGYLTATSTFYRDEKSAAQYGIFSSNWNGGTWNRIYASNFNDSGFYIGACQQQCNQTINRGWSEYSALGYSGTNSGGRLLIENSQFDNNEDGFDTNSQNADEPAPQNGACPPGVKPPVKGAHSCWVFFHNNVHDNNNPNVPSSGSAAAGPVGTGMSVSGARNDTIMDNRFSHNNAWGMILVPYLDSGPPCLGGTPGALGPGSCLWDDYGDALVGNTFSNNGSYGHPTNGDFAQINFQNDPATNCYSGNHQPGGGSVQPASAEAMQTLHPVCDGRPQPAGSSDPRFLGEVLCDSQVEITPGVPASCPSGQYPRRTRIIMHPLPKHLVSMPKPCAGVPSNPWCRRRTVRRPAGGLG